MLTGVSGSGKSVALAALEDAGYFCVDNLPPELLMDLVALERKNKARKVAVAMDARSATGLPALPEHLAQLKAQGVALVTIYLEATTDVLVRRFSETRRAHPLLTDASGDNAQSVLVEAIQLERELLSDLRDQAHIIDTSQNSAAGLRTQIKTFLANGAPSWAWAWAYVCSLSHLRSSKGSQWMPTLYLMFVCSPTPITNRRCARKPG